MILVNKEQKTVRIVNNSDTDYDWNLGGGTKRDLFIRAERRRAGLNDTHGFKTFYYGLGRLKKNEKNPEIYTNIHLIIIPFCSSL